MLLLLIVFPVQGLLDASFDAREQVFDNTVRSYAEKARLEGCFTQAIIDDMENELQTRLPGLFVSDLTIDVTTDKKYRTDEYSESSLIHFSVIMNLRKRFVGGLIFGNLENDGNMLTYTCSGSVTSEALQ